MYKKMIEEAQAKGLGSEKIMWQSVGDIDDMLCVLKKEHPEMYWKFIRKQHGLLYNGHYDEKFARWDVEQMKPLGEYWTMKQTEEALKGTPLPGGVTMYDAYVGLNAFKNDLKDTLPDDLIIKSAVKFWFKDEDYVGTDKVWRYMCMKY